MEPGESKPRSLDGALKFISYLNKKKLLKYLTEIGVEGPVKHKQVKK